MYIQARHTHTAAVALNAWLRMYLWGQVLPGAGQRGHGAHERRLVGNSEGLHIIAHCKLLVLSGQRVPAHKEVDNQSVHSLQVGEVGEAISTACVLY